MRRYILTGTPGCGKTSVVCGLEKRGCAVVHEAATDVIQQMQQEGYDTPWNEPGFIERIVRMQTARQKLPCEQNVQYYDRSPLCTYALCVYLDVKPCDVLLREMERISVEHIYERNVFFLSHIGFIQHTSARQISFEEALKFEEIHRDVYTSYGYGLVEIPKKDVPMRCDDVLNASR